MDKRTMSDADPFGKVWCSFCGLEKTEVARMFDGPAAHICGDCVAVMEGMLHEPERPAFRPFADFKAELERLRVEYGPHHTALAQGSAR